MENEQSKCMLVKFTRDYGEGPELKMKTVIQSPCLVWNIITVNMATLIASFPGCTWGKMLGIMKPLQYIKHLNGTK